MYIERKKIVSGYMNSVDVRVDMHGYVYADNSWKFDNMVIPYSKLYFIYDGSACLECGGVRHVLTPENVYLVPYGVNHSFHCDDSMEKLFFHFTMTKPSSRDLFSSVDCVRSFGIDIEQIKKLKELYFSDSVNSYIELKSEIYRAIAKFIHLYGIVSEPEPVYSVYVAKTLGYIRRHLSQSLTVGEIADKLFISESMLSKRFSAEVGISVGKYIDRQVMAEAQRQLLMSDKPIREISEKLGFCDQFYFSKKFKEFSGVSPMAYRKLRFA